MARKQGSKVKNGKKKRTDDDRQRAWSCMRILVKFDFNQVCSISGIGIDNLRRFEKRLREYGYTQVAGQYRSGRVGEFLAIKLVKNTGPLKPIIGKDGTLYDQNIKKFIERGNNGTGVVKGVEGGLPEGKSEQSGKAAGGFRGSRQPGVSRILYWES